MSVEVEIVEDSSSVCTISFWSQIHSGYKYKAKKAKQVEVIVTLCWVQGR